MSGTNKGRTGERGVEWAVGKDGQLEVGYTVPFIKTVWTSYESKKYQP